MYVKSTRPSAKRAACEARDENVPAKRTDFLSFETKFIFQCKEHANEAVEMLAYVI